MTKRETLLKALEESRKSAGEFKLKAKEDGDVLKQERFYGMEIAYGEALKLFERLGM